MNDRNGKEIVSPLDALQERAAEEREQHEKTVAMVIGDEPTVFESDLPDPFAIDLSRMSAGEVAALEAQINLVREAGNRWWAERGREEMQDHEVFRFSAEELDVRSDFVSLGERWEQRFRRFAETQKSDGNESSSAIPYDKLANLSHLSKEELIDILVDHAEQNLSCLS